MALGIGVNKLVIILMILAQFTDAAIALSYKYAINKGMSLRVIVAFRLLFACGILVPGAYVSYRRQRNDPNRPQLTWKIVGLCFACAFFGETLSSNLHVVSLNLGSTTGATAMSNLSPAITFILALVFKQETVQLHSRAGILKIVGTTLAIVGPMVVSFCKGAEINIWPSEYNSHADDVSDLVRSFKKTGRHEILSAFLAILSCTSSSFASIIQGKTIELYPNSWITSALITTMGAIQLLICTAVMDKQENLHVWQFTLIILFILFTGFIGSGLMSAAVTWCMQKKGAFYVTMFNPLALILVGFFSPLLGEKLYVGSVVGGLIIVVAVVMVLWGKKEEANAPNINHPAPQEGPEEGTEECPEEGLDEGLTEEANPAQQVEIPMEDLQGLEEGGLEEQSPGETQEMEIATEELHGPEEQSPGETQEMEITTEELHGPEEGDPEEGPEEKSPGEVVHQTQGIEISIEDLHGPEEGGPNEV